MRIAVFADSTTNVDVSTIVQNLNRVAPSITWLKGKFPFSIKEDVITFPETYDKLPTKLRREVKNDNLAVLFTQKPYDNNYFWESGQNVPIILSMYGWEHLTTLPINNGAVYFIAALLVRRIGVGKSHMSKNTGCINDFWRDKTGVDAGMRSAFICAKCNPKKAGAQGSNEFTADIQNILDHLSKASRADEDICQLWKRQQVPDAYDVFLCHNSQDKPEVRALNEKLKRDGIRTWLDEEQLPPGRPWQELLEKQISAIGAVAIIVGKSGTGPWQDMEIRTFLSEFVKRKSPTIPVILADCDSVPKLPLFLSQFTWVDFRKDTPPPDDQLVWGITGKKPVRKQRSNPSLKRTPRKRGAA